ncbi:hypothetical protein BS47DRAFT_1369935 [Hydnum rufescens UP504]|uniref:Uncharacterized protein n=1 Tax=Hydnum rufescens UP504 TaxID=1448309 RepID=A0A9P6DLA9_9AGAM|nr:hypothetical protein BS47DRAFT_1369935 [Hydnum rufescens UP504]
MPAAAGVWSKGTEYATNKKTLDDEATTRENAPTDWLREPHTRCGGCVVLYKAVGLHPQPACHEPKTRDPPNEPQRPAKRAQDRKQTSPGNDDATRHNNMGQTKPARQNQGTGVHERTTPETPDGTTHSLSVGVWFYTRLSPQLSAEREPQTQLAQERERTTQDRRDPDEPHTRFGGVLSEPTSRPATPPNTHTRERQPARQTESETREVNQPPNNNDDPPYRVRTARPQYKTSTTHPLRRYHTPAQAVPHTRYGGRYHTPTRVGWSIRTKQGII